MDRTRHSHRTPRYLRLFELIRQGDLADAMSHRPVTHGTAPTSDLLVFQVAAAQSLSAD